MSTTATDRLDGAATITPPGTDLAALEALTGTGFPARTSSNAWSLRSIAVSGSFLSITNPAGAAGDPTISIDLSTFLTTTAAAAAYQAKDSDLTAIAALAPSNDDIIQRKAGAWVNRTMAQLAADLPASGIAAGSQSDQETATSNTVAVTPGVQQFHPSAAKWWLYCTNSGTPTIAASFNLTSLTDTGQGQTTVTINVDYSSANWAGIGSHHSGFAGAGGGGGTVSIVNLAAGSCLVLTHDSAGNNADYNFSCAGFGDQ